MKSSVKSQRRGGEDISIEEEPLLPTITNASQDSEIDLSQSDSSPIEVTGSFSGNKEENHESSEVMEGVVPSQESTHDMAGVSTTAQTPQRDPKQNYQSLLSDVESLLGQLEKTSKDLAESRAEREELVEALNDLRTRVQPVGRLTNGEVMDFVKQLKYNISNLAEQWPEGEFSKNTSMDDKYRRHLQSITPESSDYRTLLENDDRRPQVVEAFIWKVLTTEVFGLFYWAGESVAPHIRGLQSILTIPGQLSSPRLCDVQMWTSKTTQLFLEAFNSRGDDEKEQTKLYLKRIKSSITTRIIEALGLSISSSSSIEEQLDDILQGAIELTKRFSQQAARWEWEYSYERHHERGLVFDGDFMDLDQGERLSSEKKVQVQKLVKFIMSPALIKRG